MKSVGMAMLTLALFCMCLGIAAAQSQQSAPDSSLISKSTKAVGYQVGGGSTKIDLKATGLMPSTSPRATCRPVFGPGVATSKGSLPTAHLAVNRDRSAHW